MIIDLAMEECLVEDCYCEKLHIPNNLVSRMDFARAVGAIIEMRIAMSTGYRMKYPN